MNPSSSIRSQIQVALIVLAGLLFAFWPTVQWMAERFTGIQSYYSHGWLIPFVVGWLIWQRRERLAQQAGRPSLAGLALLISSLLIHTLASWWDIGFASGFALVGAVAGLVWTFCGLDTLRVLSFPMAFLLFMVPLPSVVLVAMSFKLKLLAAWLATAALRGLGIAATQSGSLIHTPQVSVLVDDTCSGLSSLISLLALATLWASLFPPTVAKWRRGAVALAAIPIALAANMVRLLILALLAIRFGPKVAAGFVHYGAGLVVFAVALLALAGISLILARPGDSTRQAEPVRRVGRQRPADPAAGRPVGLVLASLVVFGLLVWWDPYAPLSGAGSRALLASSGTGTVRLGPWAGTPKPVDAHTRQILQTDDVALVEYHLGQEPPVWLTQVAGTGKRIAFHPPEICYVGSAFEVLEREPVSIFVQGTERRMVRLVLAQGAEQFEVWYWFTANGRVTPNYYQQQLWLVLDAVQGKPMAGMSVRISTPLDTASSAHRRLVAFVTSLAAATPSHPNPTALSKTLQGLAVAHGS